MQGARITAILSDYDGTLCPTNYIRNQDGTMPEELGQVLWDISKIIPICILSSKDYHFLRPRTKFARILSCIMGIETVTLKALKKEGRMTGRNIQSNKAEEGCRDTSYCIEDSHVMLNDSIGIRSDDTLNPKLPCTKAVNFDVLPILLKRFIENNLVFSPNMV